MDTGKDGKTGNRAAIGPEQLAIYGLSTNKNNGIYFHGLEFDAVKKLSFEASYTSVAKRPTEAFDLTSLKLLANAITCLQTM
jgi:hypothetical protein